MMAILLALQSFRHLIKGKCVQVLSDNVSVVAYVNFKGGPSADLTTLAKAIIWEEVLHNHVTIMVKC